MGILEIIALGVWCGAVLFENWAAKNAELERSFSIGVSIGLEEMIEGCGGGGGWNFWLVLEWTDCGTRAWDHDFTG